MADMEFTEDGGMTESTQHNTTGSRVVGGNAMTSRRGFMRVMGIGGTLAIVPGVFAACQDGTNTGGLTGPGTGDVITFDFAKGDVALLQFAYALEQLEADFYSQVVANFTGSNFTPADQLVLTDIRNHEVIHREFLKTALGANATFTITATYGDLNFKDRAAVLATASTFEDLGVSAYNGAAQYLADGNNLLLAGKIVSVEARHAAAVRDLLTPPSQAPAPVAFDVAATPTKVAFAAQAFIVEKIVFVNAPSAFGQGSGTTASARGNSNDAI